MNVEDVDFTTEHLLAVLGLAQDCLGITFGVESALGLGVNSEALDSAKFSEDLLACAIAVRGVVSQGIRYVPQKLTQRQSQCS